ncbi:hypothetical protein ACH79_40325 [Bradyrhizobium sp. CCBAU 051011]|nr:hypothetical protein ACH79_40325 [Bradyrhizobium sp. CCBAU 051011]
MSGSDDDVGSPTIGNVIKKQAVTVFSSPSKALTRFGERHADCWDQAQTRRRCRSARSGPVSGLPDEPRSIDPD